MMFLINNKVFDYNIMAKGNKFYVVWKGREVGVFSTWDSCKMQIENFKGAQYKSL